MSVRQLKDHSLASLSHSPPCGRSGQFDRSCFLVLPRTVYQAVTKWTLWLCRSWSLALGILARQRQWALLAAKSLRIAAAQQLVDVATAIRAAGAAAAVARAASAAAAAAVTAVVITGLDMTACANMVVAAAAVDVTVCAATAVVAAAVDMTVCAAAAAAAAAVKMTVLAANPSGMRANSSRAQCLRV